MAYGYKTVLLSAITVRNVDHVYECPHRTSLITSTGKKLKRRLEDLEKGSDTNSTPVGAENQAQAPRKETKRQSMKSDSNVASYKAPQPASQCIPPMYVDHERLFTPSHDNLKRSHTPPCTAYPNLHPLPDEMMLSSHGTDVPYARPTTAEAYMTTTVPFTLPRTSSMLSMGRATPERSLVDLQRREERCLPTRIEWNGRRRRKLCHSSLNLDTAENECCLFRAYASEHILLVKLSRLLHDERLSSL